MGQYRFTILLKWQLGFLIKKDEGFIEMHLPFISVLIGLEKTAHGFYIFGWFN